MIRRPPRSTLFPTRRSSDLEAGALSGAPGDYRLAAPDVVPELPATVQAVLAARIDRLPPRAKALLQTASVIDRKSTRLNSSHANISYAVFCLKKKNFMS